MNIRILLIGAAFTGVLGSVSVNAQALGGGLVGGAGGALSGGLRDFSATGAASAAGSFGADLETSTVRRTTRDVAERGVGRTRGAVQDVRGRAESSVRGASGVTQSVAADAAASASAAATHAANPQHVTGAAQLAGAAAANMRGDSAALAGAVSGEASERMPASPSADLAPAENAAPSLPAAPTSNPALNASGAGSADADVDASRDGAQTRSSFSGGANAEASVSK
jgi:hypothetical protein